MDFMGPMPEDEEGYNFLLIMMIVSCNLSKEAELIACKCQPDVDIHLNTVSVAQLFYNRVVCVHGWPQCII
eukprot:362247-Rhodomonas_salina.2